MTARARSRLIAGVLGLFVPGLGHLYIGRAVRFAAAALLLFVVVAGLALLGVFSTFVGMLFYLVTLFGVVAFGVVDPAIAAKPDVAFEPRWYNRWYVYLGWFVLVVAVVSVPRLIRESVFGFSAFRVRTASMQPAIEPRDVILVDTRAYQSRVPEVREVVVVRSPSADRMYVRRIAKRDGNNTFTFVSDNPFVPM